MLRPILEGARRRFAVAAAEVDHQDLWQRATVGMAAVSGSAGHAREVLDAAERFVWSFPEVEVTASQRDWLQRRGRADDGRRTGIGRASRPAGGPARAGPPYPRRPGQRDPARGAGRRPGAAGRHRRPARPAHHHGAWTAIPTCGTPWSSFPLWTRTRRPRSASARVRLQAAISQRGAPEAHPAAALRRRPGRRRRQPHRGHPARPARTLRPRPAATPAPGPVIDGLAVVDKPAGMTSHDVVARCRGCSGRGRSATPARSTPTPPGCCWSGLGRATRLLQFQSGLPKSYTAEVVLGVATTTLDAAGEVTGRWDQRHVTLEDARRAAASAHRHHLAGARRWCRPSRSGGRRLTSWPGRASRSSGPPGSGDRARALRPVGRRSDRQSAPGPDG